MSDAILRAHRIEEFLGDEAVAEALDTLKEANYALFVKAQTDEERRMAQARQQAFEAFADTLRAVVAVGEREQLEQEKRDRAPSTR